MDKLPYFSRGSYAALKKALNDGVYENLDRVVYYFVTEGKYAGDFCLVYTDKTIHHVSSSSLATQVAAHCDNSHEIKREICKYCGASLPLDRIEDNGSCRCEWCRTWNYVW